VERGDCDQLKGRHDMKHIFQTIKSRIKEYKAAEHLQYFKEQTIELENYITELYKKIKATLKNDKMDFSRYPFDKKYENR
jgi:cell fate (sporulation/competence/biofilm development) regulator YlbF (YheA/YmcA/DUF963 family)